VPLKPFEAIVIGSGATGGVAAQTLAEAGVRVLVVETGPELSAEEALGSEPVNSMRRIRGLLSGQHRQQAQHPGYWKHNPLLYADERRYPYSTPKDQPFLWTQGRQVGGRSLTWGGITLRLSDLEFKAAERDGYGYSWPICHQDLDPHYSALEQQFAVHGNRDGLTQLPDGCTTAPLSFTPEEQQLAADLQSSADIQMIHSRGFSVHQPSAKCPWPPSSSPGSSLKTALATGRVQVLSGHLAERLLMNSDQSRARGVVVIDQRSGERIELEAPLVVLCASTIASLRFLLLSEHSTTQGGFQDPSESLGQHLMDHVSTCRFFQVPSRSGRESLQDLDPSSQLSGAGSFFLPFGSLPPQRDGLLPFTRGYGLWGAINRFDPPWWLKRNPDCRLGFLIGHGEVLPSDQNRVTLSETVDRWGVPIPHISCQWGANETAMVNHMHSMMAEAIALGGGEIQALTDLIKMPLIEPMIANMEAMKTGAPPPGYYVHELGGAPMGNDENNSVVDPWNRLWRCPNVLVVDGSCWASSAWQSPTLTMMAITRRACLQAVRPENA
jgi:choline dehydrogenase-like flavoprotein